ncbi:hypothetical protein PTSG_08494 [Salpingoeca rosetta]|uniref:TMC domain-containing protein n=1 Tax=Salpingoeca rosetta (strain ATCC 50818 / BSB-021) TaxID=946362 RepID=F2UJV0_SALR5|nr:uncharacterized protein PTSG_08494 [Salpingoeca rosetta]EGD77399.1 hypothetical protein PTSG_08494 [Salpingoeca rosetta]|eukprot:XP_004990743.1 hypothetical protein PTSG_08494 [Salpingoeca rosetta]
MSWYRDGRGGGDGRRYAGDARRYDDDYADDYADDYDEYVDDGDVGYGRDDPYYNDRGDPRRLGRAYAQDGGPRPRAPRSRHAWGTDTLASEAARSERSGYAGSYFEVGSTMNGTARTRRDPRDDADAYRYRDSVEYEYDETMKRRSAEYLGHRQRARAYDLEEADRMRMEMEMEMDRYPRRDSYDPRYPEGRAAYAGGLHRADSQMFMSELEMALQRSAERLDPYGAYRGGYTREYDDDDDDDDRYNDDDDSRRRRRRPHRRSSAADDGGDIGDGDGDGGRRGSLGPVAAFNYPDHSGKRRKDRASMASSFRSRHSRDDHRHRHHHRHQGDIATTDVDRAHIVASDVETETDDSRDDVDHTYDYGDMGPGEGEYALATDFVPGVDDVAVDDEDDRAHLLRGKKKEKQVRFRRSTATSVEHLETLAAMPIDDDDGDDDDDDEGGEFYELSRPPNLFTSRKPASDTQDDGKSNKRDKIHYYGDDAAMDLTKREYDTLRRLTRNEDDGSELSSSSSTPSTSSSSSPSSSSSVSGSDSEDDGDSGGRGVVGRRGRPVSKMYLFDSDDDDDEFSSSDSESGGEGESDGLEEEADDSQASGDEGAVAQRTSLVTVEREEGTEVLVVDASSSSAAAAAASTTTATASGHGHHDDDGDGDDAASVATNVTGLDGGSDGDERGDAEVGAIMTQDAQQKPATAVSGALGEREQGVYTPTPETMQRQADPSTATDGTGDVQTSGTLRTAVTAVTAATAATARTAATAATGATGTATAITTASAASAGSAVSAVKTTVTFTAAASVMTPTRDGDNERKVTLRRSKRRRSSAVEELQEVAASSMPQYVNLRNRLKQWEDGVASGQAGDDDNYEKEFFREEEESDEEEYGEAVRGDTLRPHRDDDDDKTLSATLRRARARQEGQTAQLTESDLKAIYGREIQMYCPRQPHLQHRYGKKKECHHWPERVRTRKGRHGQTFVAVKDADNKLQARTRLARLEQKEQRKLDDLRKKGRLRGQLLRQQQSSAKSTLGFFTLTYYSLSLWISRLWRNLYQFFTTFELFGRRLHEVEGQFGTVVYQYFVFARSLILLNFICAIAWAAFVIIPQSILLQEPDVDFDPSDLLTGSGYFLQTTLYIGSYSNTSIPYAGLDWDMPTAYLGTALGTFLLAMVAIVITMVRRHFNSIVRQTDGKNIYPFPDAVFCSWDFTIKKEVGKKLKQDQIGNQFKDLLRRAQARNELSTGERVKLWAWRGMCNFLIMGLLAGFLFGIYRLSIAYADSEAFWEQLSAPLTATLGSSLLPTFVYGLTEAQNFSDRANLIKVLVFWSFIVKLGPIYVLLSSSLSLSTDDSIECWESQVGVDLFQLLVLNLLATCFTTVFGDVGRWVLCNTLDCFKPLSKITGEPTFQMGKSIMDVIYGQALVWIASYFSPFSIVFSVLMVLAIFWVKYASLRAFLQPFTKHYVIRSDDNYSLWVLLVTLFLCMIFIGYTILFLEPSDNCGPFRGMDTAWNVIQRRTTRWSETLQDATNFIISPAFVVPLIIVLCIALMYTCMLDATAQHETDKIRAKLDEQLRLKKRMVKKFIAPKKKKARGKKNKARRSNKK